MLNHTLEQMTELRLHGMKNALIEQMEQPALFLDRSFEERFSMLIDKEVTERKNRRIKYMLRNARLKYRDAEMSDIDYHNVRGLDKKLIQSLAQNDWLEHSHNLIITGPTGTGKTWLGQCPGYACHRLRVFCSFMYAYQHSWLNWL